MSHRINTQQGFTLIEVMVCIAIIAILLALGSINFGQAQTTVTISSATDSLLADIKSQQLLAMAGEMGDATTAQPHGIYIQPAQYTLYANTVFSSSDNGNFVFTAPRGITFSSTVPNGKLLFNKGDGSVSGFVNGSNTITVSGLSGSKTVTINRFGATTVN